MKKTTLKLVALLFGLIGFFSTTHARLNDLGNGLVNDTKLYITWMKDANLVKTSCYNNNALWQAFDLSALPIDQLSGRSKTGICDDGGTLNWYEAEGWIAVLNAQKYLGYADWRQPATAQPDATCGIQIMGQGFGYNCTGSELGNLFNVSLVNTTAPFNNPQSFYWSGTSGSNTTRAFDFSTAEGLQDGGTKLNPLFVWPVRSVIPLNECLQNDINCIGAAIKFKQVPFCDSITMSQTYGYFVIPTLFGTTWDTAVGGAFNDIEMLIQDVCWGTNDAT